MLVSPTPLGAARPRTGTALSCLALAGVLWGTGGLLGSLLGRHADLSPVAVATYRLLTGGLLLVAVLFLTGRRPPGSVPAWRRIILLSLLFVAYQVSYFAAVALTSVSLATLVTIGTSPVLVLAVERVTGRRRLDLRTTLTIILALAGLVLLVGLPGGGFTPAAVLASAGLALVAAAGFATVTLLGAAAVPGLDEQAAVGYGFTVGGLLLAPFAATTVGLGFTPTLGTLGLLVALSTAPTGLAYALYFRGLRTVGGSTATMLALLEPLTGALLAAFLLGDRLGTAGVVGAVLLATAVLLAGTKGGPDGGPDGARVGGPDPGSGRCSGDGAGTGRPGT